MKAQVVEQVTVAQAKTAIAQTAALYFAKDANGRYRIDRRRARPVCLMGPAGIGKTEVVRQVAEEQGLAFLSYSVTHHTRQSAIGLPRLSECEVDGRTVPITEYTMSEIIAEVYRVMRESGKKEGILFLDEFNCESETLRPIMLQLLQSKTFGPHTIPDGWMLVLAGNPSEYNVSARALDAVTADRLRMLWLQPDYNAWRAYMVSRGVHPVVLSYLDDHRRQFYVFEKGKDGEALVTARGWEDLSVMLRMMEEFGYPVDLPFVAQYIQSAQVAREFISYYHQYSTIIASGLADAVFTNSLTEKQEKKLSEMSFPQKWALTAVVLTRLEQICADAKRGKADAAIWNVLHFYEAFFDGAPQQEFLLGGITNTDAIALYIAEHGSDAYGASAEKVFFSDAKAPSVKKLKALLDAG